MGLQFGMLVVLCAVCGLIDSVSSTKNDGGTAASKTGVPAASLVHATSDEERLSKIKTMQALLQKELDELEARKDIARLEGMLADESVFELPAGPTAELVDVEAENEVVMHSPVQGTLAFQTASYVHGRRFVGTYMPYPLPSRMGGVTSYVAGRIYTLPGDVKWSVKFQSENRSDAVSTLSFLPDTKSDVSNDSEEILVSASANKSNAVVSDTRTTPTATVTSIGIDTKTTTGERSRRQRRNTKEILKRLRKLREEHSSRTATAIVDSVRDNESANAVEEYSSETLMTSLPQHDGLEQEADIRDYRNRSSASVPRYAGKASTFLQGQQKDTAQGSPFSWTVIVCVAAAMGLGVSFGFFIVPLDVLRPGGWVRKKDSDIQLLYHGQTKPQTSSTLGFRLPINMSIGGAAANDKGFRLRNGYMYEEDGLVVRRRCSNTSSLPL